MISILVQQKTWNKTFLRGLYVYTEKEKERGQKAERGDGVEREEKRLVAAVWGCGILFSLLPFAIYTKVSSPLPVFALQLSASQTPPSSLADPFNTLGVCLELNFIFGRIREPDIFFGKYFVPLVKPLLHGNAG